MSPVPTIAGGLTGLLALALFGVPGSDSRPRAWMDTRPEDRGSHIFFRPGCWTRRSPDSQGHRKP